MPSVKSFIYTGFITSATQRDNGNFTGFIKIDTGGRIFFDNRDRRSLVTKDPSNLYFDKTSTPEIINPKKGNRVKFQSYSDKQSRTRAYPWDYDTLWVEPDKFRLCRLSDVKIVDGVRSNRWQILWEGTDLLCKDLQRALDLTPLVPKGEPIAIGDVILVKLDRDIHRWTRFDQQSS